MFDSLTQKEILDTFKEAVEAQTPSECDITELRLLRLVHGVRWRGYLKKVEKPPEGIEHISEILPRVIEEITRSIGGTS